jgi:hypothetical protein
VWLAAVLSVCGCASARVVSRDQYGGIVAIPSNSDDWPTHYRKSAEELMARQCPQGYVVESEGEVVVGQHTTDHVTGNNNSAASLLFGIGSEQHSVQTHDIKEWQIRYRTKDAPPAAVLMQAGLHVPAPAGQTTERLPETPQSLPKTPVPIAQ